MPEWLLFFCCGCSVFLNRFAIIDLERSFISFSAYVAANFLLKTR